MWGKTPTRDVQARQRYAQRKPMGSANARTQGQACARTVQGPAAVHRIIQGKVRMGTSKETTPCPLTRCPADDPSHGGLGTPQEAARAPHMLSPSLSPGHRCAPTPEIHFAAAPVSVAETLYWQCRSPERRRKGRAPKQPCGDVEVGHTLGEPA